MIHMNINDHTFTMAMFVNDLRDGNYKVFLLPVTGSCLPVFGKKEGEVALSLYLESYLYLPEPKLFRPRTN